MEIKRVLKYFTIFEWEKEQDYLRKMHQSGWKLVKISGLCLYRFAKCSPEDVIYQLDYNREGRAHKAEYLQLFRDCGWEYLQDYVGYSYFRKPAARAGEEEKIFCDEPSRMDMLDRVFKGRLFPLFALFLCVLIPAFVGMLGSGQYAVSSLLGVIICLYIVIFALFTCQYSRLKQGK